MPGIRGRASAEANGIADAVIRAMRPMTPRHRIAEEILRRCTAAGVDRARLGSARMEDGAPERPVLTLAVLDPTRTIVACSLDHSATSGPDVVARLLADLDQRHGGALPIIVRLPALASRGWPELRGALETAGIQVATPVERPLRLGREMDLLIGRRLADLRLGERRSRAAASPDALAGMDALRSAVDAAVAGHNAARGGDVRPFSLTGFRGFVDGWFR